MLLVTVQRIHHAWGNRVRFTPDNLDFPSPSMQYTASTWFLYQISVSVPALMRVSLREAHAVFCKQKPSRVPCRCINVILGIHDLFQMFNNHDNLSSAANCLILLSNIPNPSANVFISIVSGGISFATSLYGPDVSIISPCSKANSDSLPASSGLSKQPLNHASAADFAAELRIILHNAFQ